MNIDKMTCCENMLITCFAFYLDVRCDLRNAIQIFSCRSFLWQFVLDHVKCDSRNTIQVFFLQKLFVTIRFRDFAWLFHRQCFWLSSLDSTSDACSFLTRQVTYVCSRCIERRMCLWWNDSDDRISSNWERFIIWKRFKNDSDNRILSNCERFIKLDESDLSSLMRTIHECWWDEISSNL